MSPPPRKKTPPKAPPRTPRVFTIPAGLPFVDVLAAGIAERWGTDPAALARVTVLVPTQRARRSLAEAFLRQSDGRAMLLPRTVALGDLDEDEILFAGGFEVEDSLGVEPALPGLKRQLLLTRLVMAGPGDPSPDHAAHLGLELARLLDQVHTERLTFDGLQGLVPDAFAEHWQRTLEFLHVLTEQWPAVLAEEGALDAAERRNRLFDAQVRAWTADQFPGPPADPVIAAGSTGSIPATADLLAVIAGLPQGAVVLPGLDLEATPEAWTALEASHPQYGMAQLLARLGVERQDVGPWDAPGAAVRPSAPARLINAALTPAGFDAPSLNAKDIKAALKGITRIDSPGPREEAAVIALVMRRVLEDGEKTAALVTPDRGLARRVAAELARWGIEIDDSAGLPLAQTPPGAFLRLTARMAADGLTPVALLAALKHPLAAAGMKVVAFRDRVRTLEVELLRGPRPAPGLKGLRLALKTKRKLPKKTQTDLNALLKDLEAVIAPLAGMMAGKPVPFSDLLRAHVTMAEALAAGDEADGPARLWAGDAGEVAAKFINELVKAGEVLDEITGADYPALLETLMAGIPVRPRYGRHPRLHIWGLLEARMQQADVMILGGLNDATWPPEAKPSPWMSRPMLKDFGLPPPERRGGQTAHDFAQAFAAPRVVLTRATRVDGTPQVASPWLLRLDNLLERLGLKKGDKNPFAAAEPWLAWAEALDRPTESRQVTEPQPTPPVKDRPRELSVTRIETWVRDPYAIYAREILRLRPLDPLDAEPGPMERGIIVHEALDRFQKAHTGDLPDDALRRLLEIGRGVFDENLAHPGVEAFWWPRFERVARWYVDYERRRRQAGFTTKATEVMGAMTLNGAAGPFQLTARADRIDFRADIGLAVIDYKTGAAPSKRQVESGFSPQLPLEAAIAAQGGFDGIDAGPVAQLVYLELPGGRDPGREKVLDLDVAEAADGAVAGLTKWVREFDDPKTPYLSSPRVMFLEHYGDYDHLARVKEWRGGGEGGP
ncbi:MAG: double-strand break repair protein AddB [Rhodospirillaceae bacterium]|nr:double-strand break repair protein AddB [Rhodospirillaceae bacterium]|tara:strand:- start:2158 stop:5181 length:3024 start_codon:yes stop_codon:yes gene_type:complete